MVPAPLQVVFAADADYLVAFDAEISKKGLLVRGASVAATTAGTEVALQVKVAARPVVVLTARVAAIVPGVGVAVMFDGIPPALAALADKARNPPEEEDAKASGPLSERLKALSPSEKMALAIAGSRDERTMLLRDNNKMVHVYVLKNPRIGVDEVQAAAKQAQLSPDALKMIAEHREWGTNPVVCAALVRNPKTPLPLALRLIDKVPMADLRALAKGGAREQVVAAARKKIAG